ncbi:MAG: MATE family efflux transporter, partial [Pseudomonadota bacterium]
LLFGSSIIALLTPDGAIREAANAYLIWVVISPLIVVVGFQLDGIFIGATKAREMRDGMIVSAAIFLGASIWMAERWENHGLWAAFSLYFVLRAATLGWYFQRQRFWRLSEAQGSEDAAAKPS